MNDPQLRPKWEADLDSKMLEALDMNLFKQRLKIYYTKTDSGRNLRPILKRRSCKRDGGGKNGGD
jgi:hypothetical protein